MAFRRVGPHFGTFILSEGARYQDLAPDADLVYPQRTIEVLGNTGWAYCARTPDRGLFMIYFERGLAGLGGLDNPRRAGIRGARRNGRYRATWFDPRTGAWYDAGTLQAGESCLLPWPEFPRTTLAPAGRHRCLGRRASAPLRKGSRRLACRRSAGTLAGTRGERRRDDDTEGTEREIWSPW